MTEYNNYFLEFLPVFPRFLPFFHSSGKKTVFCHGKNPTLPVADVILYEDLKQD